MVRQLALNEVIVPESSGLFATETARIGAVRSFPCCRLILSRWRMNELDDIAAWDFELPTDRIASTPLPTRSGSRLLTLAPDGQWSDGYFAGLLDAFLPNDVLVFNDTRVLAARVEARRASGGKVELLVVGRAREGRWAGDEGLLTAMVRSNRRVQDAEQIEVVDADGAGTGVFLALQTRDDQGLAVFTHPGALFSLLDAHGRLPLPPYIEEQRAERGEAIVQADDAERYQTVVANECGAVAAPTAGLHFDDAFLAAAQAKGVAVERVTLHVGIGTFRPVKSATLSAHHMHEEYCIVPADVAERLNARRAAGGRIIAVGTTVVRTLESFVDATGQIRGGEGGTEIFIRPGYTFRAVDAMLTNFHLPKSTLLALVAAFVGHGPLLRAYAHAVEAEYRFFSYGDAMWLPGPQASTLSLESSS